VSDGIGELSHTHHENEVAGRHIVGQPLYTSTHWPTDQCGPTKTRLNALLRGGAHRGGRGRGCDHGCWPGPATPITLGDLIPQAPKCGQGGYNDAGDERPHCKSAAVPAPPGAGLAAGGERADNRSRSPPD